MLGSLLGLTQARPGGGCSGCWAAGRLLRLTRCLPLCQDNVSPTKTTSLYMQEAQLEALSAQESMTQMPALKMVAYMASQPIPMSITNYVPKHQVGECSRGAPFPGSRIMRSRPFATLRRVLQGRGASELLLAGHVRLQHE